MKLEQLGIKHLEAYLLLVNNPTIPKTTQPLDKDLIQYTKSQITNWLNSLKEKSDRKDFAIMSSSNNFIGEVILNHIKDNSANIRIAILPEYFDQGYGTQSMKQTIEYGFNCLELNKITLSVYDINPRGLRLYKKLGFKETSRKTTDNITEIQMELLKP